MSGGETEKSPGSPWPHTVLDWIGLMAKIVVIAGAAFAVYQYLDVRRDMRVARTMEFVERFESAQSDVGAAQRTISTALWPVAPEIKKLQSARLDEDAARKIKEQIVEFLVKDADNGRGLQQPLDTVVGFLEALNVCVREKLCEADVASAFFGDYALRLWNNFSTHVMERRQTAPGYGGGLEWFAKSVQGKKS